MNSLLTRMHAGLHACRLACMRVLRDSPACALTMCTHATFAYPRAIRMHAFVECMQSLHAMHACKTCMHALHAYNHLRVHAVHEVHALHACFKDPRVPPLHFFRFCCRPVPLFEAQRKSNRRALIGIETAGERGQAHVECSPGEAERREDSEAVRQIQRHSLYLSAVYLSAFTATCMHLFPSLVGDAK